MHESHVNRLHNEIRRLRLAVADMRQAAAAADALAHEHYNGDLCRALETALVICYTRPFTSGNAVGTLGIEWQPEYEEGRKLHTTLVTLRNKVYAHSDWPAPRRC